MVQQIKILFLPNITTLKTISNSTFVWLWTTIFQFPLLFCIFIFWAMAILYICWAWIKCYKSAYFKLRKPAFSSSFSFLLASLSISSRRRVSSTAQPFLTNTGTGAFTSTCRSCVQLVPDDYLSFVQFELFLLLYLVVHSLWCWRFKL